VPSVSEADSEVCGIRNPGSRSAERSEADRLPPVRIPKDAHGVFRPSRNLWFRSVPPRPLRGFSRSLETRSRAWRTSRTLRVRSIPPRPCPPSA